LPFGIRPTAIRRPVSANDEATGEVPGTGLGFRHAPGSPIVWLGAFPQISGLHAPRTNGSIEEDS